MPKPFSPEEKRLICERLIEQGTIQFSTFGLKKTSVEELAAAAGISKAAFYLFFESKEAFFMDVVERAEERFRQEVLAVIDLPGPSAHARLSAAFKQAFRLWKTIPVLRFFTQSEYERLARHVPAEKIQEHVSSDRAFIDELIARCQAAEIPIQAQAGEIGGLLYALFFVSLHEDDLGAHSLTATIELLADLIAAYCLGEVASVSPAVSANPQKVQPYETGN